MNDKKTKVSLAILLGNLLLTFVGISLVIPVMPSIMHELSISGSVVGYLVSTFALAQLIVSPIAGKWADQFGRKVMIIIGLVIYAVSELLFGFGNSAPVLFISRILGGISGAFIMPAVTAFIADITTKKERPKALGYMSAAINTGFIIGPGLGGLLAEYGTRAPFIVAAILAFISSVISFFLLKEPIRADTEQPIEKQKAGFKQIFVPIYFIPFVLILISSFGLSSFESLFSLFVDHKFHFTPKDIAIIVTGGGLVGALAQIFLFDRLEIKFGEMTIVRYSLILSAVLVYMMTMVEAYLSILLISCIVFVGFDLIRPAITSYLSKIAGNEQGFVGGMNSSFTSIGNIFGPIMGGILFDIDLNYPFYFATIVIVIGVFIAYVWKANVMVEGKV